ncbi:phosphoribosyltransferase [Brevibacillus borstelensis]|uniref:phosphoribosyltransferase n=1 Tax=Brevibacillus borstelensis TaxID=45462 RepID=UPI002E206F5C|nr:phosphoribosyltransferase [Brevibacillus borstelensis]
MYKNEETGIYYLCDYIPYRLPTGEVNPRFDTNSGRILDVKSDDDRGIDHFFPMLDKIIPAEVAIAVVPSHNPEKTSGGLYRLVNKLASKKSRIDASSCLVRKYMVDKLAHGGSRHIEVHTRSIGMTNLHLIKGRKVVVLDDVTTTGNSLLACQQILLSAGASNVKCVALGQTEGY